MQEVGFHFPDIPDVTFEDAVWLCSVVRLGGELGSYVYWRANQAHNAVAVHCENWGPKRVGELVEPRGLRPLFDVWGDCTLHEERASVQRLVMNLFRESPAGRFPWVDP